MSISQIHDRHGDVKLEKIWQPLYDTMEICPGPSVSVYFQNPAGRAQIRPMYRQQGSCVGPSDSVP